MTCVRRTSHNLDSGAELFVTSDETVDVLVRVLDALEESLLIEARDIRLAVARDHDRLGLARVVGLVQGLVHLLHRLLVPGVVLNVEALGDVVAEVAGALDANLGRMEDRLEDEEVDQRQGRKQDDQADYGVQKRSPEVHGRHSTALLGGFGDLLRYNPAGGPFVPAGIMGSR